MIPVDYLFYFKSKTKLEMLLSCKIVSRQIVAVETKFQLNFFMNRKLNG